MKSIDITETIESIENSFNENSSIKSNDYQNFSTSTITNDNFNNDSLNDNQLNETEDNTPNILINDLSDFLNDDKINKQDLAAAFLAAFYSGASSQKSLKDYLELINMLPQNYQMPTTFSGLISLLNDNKKKLNYNKSWYCSVYNKIISKLDNRFQRECNSCNTR